VKSSAPWSELRAAARVESVTVLQLPPRAGRIAQSLGIRRFAVSLTHEPAYAAAVVVATR